MNGGEYTRVRSSVVSGTRVGDLVWIDRPCQGHSSEGGVERCNPRKPWRSTNKHGRRRVRHTAESLERPHRDAPRPRVVERGLGCTPWRRRRRIAPTARTRTTSPLRRRRSPRPPTASRPRERRTKKRRRRRS